MRIVRALVVALLSLLALTGAVGAQRIDPTREPSAQLRFVNALGDRAPVTVTLDGEAVVSGLPHADGTRYGLVRPGQREISARTAGGDTLAMSRVTLGGGRSYTAVLSRDEKGTARLLVYEDDLSPAAEGRGALRLINLRPSEGRLAAVVGDAALSQLRGYGEASPPAAVPVGVAPIRLIDEHGRPRLTTPEIPFSAGSSYTIFAVPQGEALSFVILSYPLATGAPPVAPTWLPLASGSGAVSAAGGGPGPTLPVAGGPLTGDGLPISIVAVGLLVLLTSLSLTIRRRLGLL